MGERVVPSGLTGLLEKLSEANVEIFSSVFYTPPDKAREFKGERLTSHPPKSIREYSDFIEDMINRYGEKFKWVQIWNEPNWKVYWREDLDPDYEIFSEMGKMAADTIHKYGKKVALGGLTLFEYPWIVRMHEKGLLQKVDSVSFHESPGSWLEKKRWFVMGNRTEYC